MKKLLVLIVFTGMLLVGCGGNADEVPENPDKRFNGFNSPAEIVTDSETGCKYIYIDRGIFDNRVVAVSPLMKNETEVDCGQ